MDVPFECAPRTVSKEIMSRKSLGEINRKNIAKTMY
jgi:hypothetical protein